MNAPDERRPIAEISPGMPRDEDGPVFREPWEAQAFAMTPRPAGARAIHCGGMVRGARR